MATTAENVEEPRETTVPEAAGPKNFMKYLPSYKLLAAAFGIIGSLLLYAVLQERIMTKVMTIILCAVTRLSGERIEG